jgi:CDP-paratose 2-epimerase
MRILIAGVCGFVGSTLANGLLDSPPAGERVEIVGIDSFVRRGSEINRQKLIDRGVRVIHADVRNAGDFDLLPAVDWVIDCAANPAVLAGVDGTTSSRSVFDHNLLSTINLLEYCKRHKSGFMLMSTSRVYSIPTLAGLPLKDDGVAFQLDAGAASGIRGLDVSGITEDFSTAAPISLYGASKLASEAVALEYGETFGLPIWINRCGVLAGAGQFGRADQGIFSFWINAYLRRRPLKYIGFGGKGLQVRDFLHPLDLLPVMQKQFAAGARPGRRVYNIGGGAQRAMSLRQLSDWCRGRFGDHPVTADTTPRQFDIPWVIMNSSCAIADFCFAPEQSAQMILEEIARHAEANPSWLEISGS